MTKTRLLAASAALAMTCTFALAGCKNGGEDSAGGATDAATTTAAADSGAGTADTGDACSLLTGADVSGVLGVAYDEAKHNDDLSVGKQDICEWFASDGSVAFVQVLTLPGADQYATQYSSAADVMGDAKDVTVPGASNAYVVASGSILGMAVGDGFIQVSNITTTNEDATAATVALATIVAGNAS